MHKFSPANWQRLESEARRNLIPPEETLRRFGLKSEMTFVDIGAGTGYFSREAARIVGDGGNVFAVEMSPSMIEQMKSLGMPLQVDVIQSEEYAIPLRDSVADLTWLSFVTHENPDVPRLLKEAARVTKGGGRIVIVEWKKQDEEIGPPKEERISQEALRNQVDHLEVIAEGSLNASHYYIEMKVTKT